ncbi:MAG: carboxypeptidase regulatory-like domain-containing protein [Blastocatellia bacterium]|nr:carboxypeptidase regulatory-like domain-containing protein [Blastocatellia bacterium]
MNISGLTLSNGNGTGGGSTFGGAILAENNSNLKLDKIILSSNFAEAYGAAFLSGGAGRVINSTISTNSANTGLAIGVSGTLNIANTTVSGNLDADGGTGIGAIYVTGTANIRNSTIAFNRTSGGTGGGIFNAGTLNIGNTIVSNNIAATSPDIHRSSGTITSVGGNLVQNPNGFPAGTFSQLNDVTGVDPNLAALANNGGNVPTHALDTQSPAVNTGINANAIDPFDNSVLVYDARGVGFNRIVGGLVDKGAFETVGPTASNARIAGRVTGNGVGVKGARVTVADANNNARNALTNNFGYYVVEDLEAGQTYVISVSSKRFRFSSQIRSVTESISDLDFVGEE